MLASLVLYSWRILDKRTGRWRTLSWKMTEDEAEASAKSEGAELQKVEGSAKKRTDVDGRPK